MAPPSNKFLEEHKDFVLKLKIKATDGTSQIRRVRLPRIADCYGNLSYEELVGLVVTFTFPEGSPENYQVSLTYFDVDEDAVTVASTDELVDAIEQFSGKSILRISTEVKPKTKPSSPPRASTPPAAGPESSTRTDRGTSTREPPFLQPQIHKVLESFVGILATAVSSLQEGLADPKPKPRAASPVAPVNGTTTSGEAAGTATSEEAAPCAAPAESENIGDTTAEPEATEDEEKKPEDDIENTETAPKEGDEEEGPPPFIHGRHTCDSCLITPIIGQRYHAANLPDYDLCSNCFKNYKGTEAQFEPVELDRDIPFQERWHRRRDKIQRFEARRATIASGVRGRRNRAQGQRGQGPWGRGRGQNRFKAGPPGPPPPCPPGPHCPPGPPPHHHGIHHHGPSHRGPPHWAHIGPHVGPHMHGGPPCAQFVPSAPIDHIHASPSCSGFVNPPATSTFDTALKEAIRRSLRDIAPKEAEIFGEAKPTAPVEETTAETEEAKPTAPVEETTPEKEEAKPTASVEETTTEKEEASTTSAGASFPSKELVVETVEEDIVVKADIFGEEPDFTVQPEGDIEEARESSNEEEAEQSAFEDAWETGSVDSEKMVAGEEEMDKKPPAVDRETSGSQKTDANESFASDAVGSGEAAEAMGLTLDNFAGLISEMLSEADSHNKTSAPEETKEEDKTAASPGALILDPVENSTKPEDSFEKEENDDWQVVKADGSEEESVAGDEEIARAAEMLGSALFNSDMKGSEDDEDDATAENLSTLSDSFSLPSTVPSISVGSHLSQVAAAQRARWALQLSKLSELGFDNERLSVDILERLQAANIGVDSDDDVSVTQVVNAILERS